VNFFSWGDAARFCNWLQNGQKSGEENDLTTEAGAYALHGANTNDALMQVTRDPNAQYFIPNLNEWYKTAYYDPNKLGPGQPGYWLYPTRHDDPPINKPDPLGTNNANFFDELGTGTGGFCIGGPLYRTEVGAFAASPGPYGTYDQGGNVGERTDTIATSLSRKIKSGSYETEAGALSKFVWTDNYATWESEGGGFRVGASSVPEPDSRMMLGAVVLGILCWWRWDR
jgi:formylglycine-generating enzyme